MINKNFIIYDASGRILRTGDVPEIFIDDQAQDGEFMMEGTAHFINDYVKRNVMVDEVPIDVAVPRPTNPATLTNTVLNNVPVPAVVSVNAVDYPTTEATVELDLTYPSTYNIVVSAFPYLDKTFTVTT